MPEQNNAIFGGVASRRIRTLEETIPVAEETLFEQAGKGFLELLDAPENVVRATIAGDPKTAFATLIPGINARRVDISEVTGTEDFATNLFWGLALDPLLYTGGVLNLTKVGKAEKLVSTLTNEVKVLNKLGTAAEVAEATKRLRFAEQKFAELMAKEVGKSAGATRSFVKFNLPFQKGGLELKRIPGIGTVSDLKNTLANLNIFPDLNRIGLEHRAAALSGKIARLEKDAARTGLGAKGGDVYFHGTPDAFDEVEGVTSVFGTKDPIIARKFSEGASIPVGEVPSTANIRPFKVRGRILKSDSKEYEAVADEIVEFIYKNDSIVGLIQLERVLSRKNNWHFWENPLVVKELKERGYAAVEMFEEFEVAGKAKNIKTIQVFDPKNIISFGAREFEDTKQLTKLRKLLAETEGALETSNRGILPIGAATKIRRAASTVKAMFNTKSSDELLQTAVDVTKTKEAKAFNILDKEVVAAGVELEELAKLNKIDTIEQAKKLLEIGERRFISMGALPSVTELANKEGRELYTKFIKAQAKINKIKDPVKRQERLVEEFDKFRRGANRIKLNAEERRLSLAMAEKTIKNATPEELAFVDKYVSTVEELPIIETAAGIHSPTLQTAQGMLSFMRRRLTPYAKKLKRTDKNKFKIMYAEAKIRLASAAQRVLYPEKSILEINDILKTDYGAADDFFDPHVIRSIADRRAQSISAVNRAKFINFALDEIVQKGLSKSNSISVSQFLKRAGLDPKNRRYSKLIKLRIDKAKADEVLGIHRILKNNIFNNAEELGYVLRLVEKVNAIYRPALTVAFPAFHNRNFIGNIYNNMLLGVHPLKHLKQYIQAGRLQKRVALGQATEKELALWDELVEFRIVNRGQFQDIKDLFEAGLEESRTKGALRAFFEKPISSTIIKPLFGKELPIDPFVGRAFGNAVENNARIAHYLVKKAEGMSSLEAMRSVNKALFDYSDITAFERKFARPTFLFYTWLRKNLPLQVSTTIHTPRVASIYEDVTGINHDHIPAYLKASRAFSVGGRTEVIGSIGLPIEDLNLLNIADADPLFFDQLSRLSDKIISRSSPAIRVPLELLQGRTSFSRRSLSSLSPTELIKEFLPIGRVVRTGEKLFDPEEPIKYRVIDLLSGLRTYKTDPLRIEIDKLKRHAISTGKFTRSGFLVIPKQAFRDDEEARKIVSTISRLQKQRQRNRIK